MSVTTVSLARRREAAMTTGLVNALLVVVVICTASGVALVIAADEAVGWTGYESADAAVFLALFPLLPITGAMLARRRPDNAIGWLFLAAALCIAISAFAHGWGDYGLYARPDSLPAAAEIAWWTWTGWVGFVLLAVMVPLLYPTGRLPSPRWRPVAVAGAGAAVAVAAQMALRPGPLTDYPDAQNPVGVPALRGVLGAVEDAATPLMVVALVGALASMVARYRAADPPVRRQLHWFAWTAGVLLVVDIAANLLAGGGLHDHLAHCTWGTATSRPVYGTAVPVLLLAGLPAAVAVAVLRHDLYSLNRFIRRSAVYATLWACIALTFVAVAWTLGVTTTGRIPVALSVAVTIAATMAFQPARAALERVADRWVFGPRFSGLELVSGWGGDLRGSGDLAELAGSLAQIVRRGLGADWARVRFDAQAGGPSASATAGELEPRDRVHLRVPVRHGDATIGAIECGPTPGRRRDGETRQLLELLAHEAALSAHNVVLAASLREQMHTVDAQAAELSASRARILTAQEAERRRLERDIHDGAQQELVAMMAKLRITLDLVERDCLVARNLQELQHDAKAALAGIRELAQGIHPAVLTDEGLVAAVEARTARLPLPVEVQAEPEARDRRFPDAVEGAAFFVVTESIANVLKHAGASRVLVRIGLADGALSLEIDDDGAGFDPEYATGDGLTRLADRVAGLGGHLSVRSGAGGTRVSARIPVGRYT